MSRVSLSAAKTIIISPSAAQTRDSFASFVFPCSLCLLLSQRAVLLTVTVRPFAQRLLRRQFVASVLGTARYASIFWWYKLMNKQSTKCGQVRNGSKIHLKPCCSMENGVRPKRIIGVQTLLDDERIGMLARASMLLGVGVGAWANALFVILYVDHW